MERSLYSGIKAQYEKELPEDLVGLGPACLAQLGEEHDALLCLLVQLKVQENVAPATEGLSVATALNEAQSVVKDLRAKLRNWCSKCRK